MFYFYMMNLTYVIDLIAAYIYICTYVNVYIWYSLNLRMYLNGFYCYEYL